MEQEQLTPKEAYQIDDIVEFKVRSLFTNYCEVVDEKTGIISYLQGTEKLFLLKGQVVKCRVTAVREKHPKIELVDITDFEQNQNSLTEAKLTQLIDTCKISWNTKDFVKLILCEEKDNSYGSLCHRWIQGLLNKKIDLQLVRRDCSDLLELSDFLNICGYNERDFYQERMTFLIEQLGYHIRAAELIENDAKDSEDDTSEAFINTLFNKLKVSGFIYHPSKNFNILSCLFIRKPALMNERMRDLLEIISAKDIRIWEREPFGGALIKLLELYIRECDGKIDKVKDNETLINNNMLALAIQLLIIKDTEESNVADYRLNAAKLCILSSYVNKLKPEVFVNNAYYILFSPNAKLPAYTMGNIKVLPHYIFSSPCGNIDTINSFSKGNVRLLISEGGIHLQTVGNKKDLRPVFPNNLSLWKNMQVFLPSKTETSLQSVKQNEIAPYQSVWSEIESEFFNVKKAPVVVVNKNKKQHRINESVKITFTSQDVNNKSIFYCQIEDETGGNGFIFINDIVGYNITPSLRHFYASDGSRYVFNALIIDKEDDLFHFSMFDDLKDYLSKDYYSYDEDIICSVGGTPNISGIAPAISKEGVSVSLRNAKDYDGLRKYDVVRCRLVGPGTGTFHVTCDVIDLDASDFDLNTSFKNLMEDCSVGKIPENLPQEEEEEQILESDKLIDASYVKEVIYMIDRMALIDKEYVKSYNYLGFARILCLMIGWESQAAYYKGRMDIITMLHEFALNAQVDEEKLVQLENANAELFSNNVVLRERFLQLQTISFIGKDTHNEDLFKLSCSNPSLKNLASLVLAYNITRLNGLESSATNIHNKIIQLLNLKGFETSLKLYGTGEETEEIEYKTSILFSAEDSSNTPNPHKQMDEILKVIDSFLNTRGGTLYIGVNNYGYGVGLENDLSSDQFYGDKDKYKRYILDQIAITWGNNILTTYIKDISFDEENTDKSVLIIKINPVPSGLPYNGDWYVRIAGSKRKLNESEYNDYQRTNRRLHEVSTDTEKEVVTHTSSSNEGISDVSVPLVTTKDDIIKTSRIRKNVLLEWEDTDNYVPPIGFFKFLNGGKFQKIVDYDYDTDTLLTLVVKESEEKGFLILGYENGYVVKVSVEELLDYSTREYSRNTDSNLIFASLAQNEDAILTISRENKSKPRILMRIDKVSGFDEGRLMDSGELVYDEVGEILTYDIIPHENIEDFRSIFERAKPNNSVTVNMVKKLHNWGITEI